MKSYFKKISFVALSILVVSNSALGMYGANSNRQTKKIPTRQARPITFTASHNQQVQRPFNNTQQNTNVNAHKKIAVPTEGAKGLKLLLTSPSQVKPINSHIVQVMPDSTKQFFEGEERGIAYFVRQVTNTFLGYIARAYCIVGMGSAVAAYATHMAVQASANGVQAQTTIADDTHKHLIDTLASMRNFAIVAGGVALYHAWAVYKLAADNTSAKFVTEKQTIKK